MFNGAAPDDWHAYRRYPFLLSRLAFYLLIAWLVYTALGHAAGVLSMLMISLLAAYVLDPVVDWFEARRFSRTAAIVLLTTLVVLFALVFTGWMLPVFMAQFGRVGTRIHELIGQDPSQLVTWAATTFGIEVSADQMTEVKAAAQKYAPKVLAAFGSVLQSAAAKSMGVLGWLLNLVMIPVFIFYFLRDFDSMKRWCVEHLPLQHRDKIVERGHRVDGVVGAWLRGQVEVACILAVLYAIGLSVVGIELAIPIGILAGLINVVPYLGYAVGFGMAAMMCLLEWTGAGPLIGVMIVFVVVHLLEGYVLTPKIVGDAVGLAPVTVLIVLLLGGELFGLLGFLLAVPVSGAVKTILLEVLDWYKNSEHYLGP